VRPMGRNPPIATVLLSGGIDSAACAHFLGTKGFAVTGLFIDYGQAAATLETRASSALSTHLSIPLKTYRLSGEVTFGAGELIGRNAFFLAASLFLTQGKSSVLGLGIHAGTPYYDSSEGFLESLRKVIAEHTDGKVTVVAPFVTWPKRDVYQYFASTGIPIELCYSCEAGTVPPCGICLSCKDRKAMEC
jgi:7-cyano-7-deazaguanine synthase